METTSHNQIPAAPDIQPLLIALKPEPPVKHPAFDQWQKLPIVWMPPPTVPPQQDEFRNWGINE